MAILVTNKYEEDPIKIEGARVATTQNIDFSNTQRTKHSHISGASRFKKGLQVWYIQSQNLLFVAETCHMIELWRLACISVGITDVF